MQLQNSTRYSTREIGKVIRLAYQLIAKTEGARPQWAKTKIRVVYSRHSLSHSGYAYLNGTLAHLCIPKDAASTLMVFNLAWHEIMHLYGYNHKQFSKYPPEDVGRACIKGLPDLLREVESPVVAKPDLKVVRYQQTLQALDRWEPKLTSIQKRVRKLKERKAYYEKTLPKAALESVKKKEV